MAKVAGIVKGDSISNGKPTLVRRVSDMFKDGTYSGPPSLFRHTSMQKIRHCCQNLNLLPYLLYSVDNSKSHTINRKVNVCLRHLLRSLTERIFLLYRSLRQTVLRGISTPTEALIIQNVDNTASRHLDQEEESINKTLSPKFQQFQKQKRKQNCPLLLTLAIYLAPLVLAFQLIVVFGLMIFEPYTPGFVFLISATMFIGCITMKILFHDTVSRRDSVSQRKKTQ